MNKFSMKKLLSILLCIALIAYSDQFVHPFPH